jgi:PAS domain S-box-containing protein
LNPLIEQLKRNVQNIQAGIGIIEITPSGKVLHLNKEAAEWLGVNAEALAHMQADQYLKIPFPLENAEEAKATSHFWSGIIQLRQGKRWVNVPASLIPVQSDQNGKEIIKWLIKFIPLEITKSETIDQQIQEEKRRLQAQLAEHFALEQRLMKQQQAIQRLTKEKALKEGELHQTLPLITRVIAETLEVPRVEIWLKEEDDHRFRLILSYALWQQDYTSSDEVFHEHEDPTFFSRLSKGEIIAIDNVYHSPYSFLIKHHTWLGEKTRALLFSPFFLEGELAGFLSLHRNEKQNFWLSDEINFVLAVSEMISLSLEQGNKKAIEEELRNMLETALAMEEELRQNLEEIEATNDELRRTHIELQGQINALNNATLVVEFDLNHNILYTNQTLLNLLQYEKENLFQQPYEKRLSKKNDEALLTSLWTAINQGRVWKGELLYESKDGKTHWMMVTITPVLNEAQKPIKFISVAVDISQQKLQEKQLEEALKIAVEQEQALIESQKILEAANEELTQIKAELEARIHALDLSAYICEVDPMGKILYVNQQLIEALGYESRELISQNLRILLSGRQNQALYRELYNAIEKGKTWNNELELRTKLGDYLWVIATVTPVFTPDGSPAKSIFVLNNITEQKQQEFRLRKQQETLLFLSKSPQIRSGNIANGFQLIVEKAREAFDADRVSIWIFQEDVPDKASCVAVSQRIKHRHEIGITISKSEFQAYFDLLERDRIVVSANVHEDPHLSDIAQHLFPNEPQVAILDAAILLGDKIVGIISVEDHHRIRHWHVDEQSFINSLADTAGIVFEQREMKLTEELRQAYEKLEKINQEVLEQKKELEEKTIWMLESLKYAKRIQRNLLPDQATLNKYLVNYFIVYRPKEIVGGDFYWFHADDPYRIIIVADGTGHGVPGAFITLIGHMLLNQIVVAQKIYKPSEILYHLHIGVRKTLKQDVEDSTSRDGMDIAVVLYNSENRKLQYAGANLPLYYYQNWDLHTIKPDKLPIGGEQMEEERIFTNHEIQLYPGDAIYLYTDGFVDQIGGPEKKRFSTRRFRDLILRTQHESMATQRALLNMEWKEWKGDDEQLDDVTVFGMKIS